MEGGRKGGKGGGGGRVECLKEGGGREKVPCSSSVNNYPSPTEHN